jgi:hypothetical protein
VIVADGQLYAAFRTGDPSALSNSGGDIRYLFKTGGALDLMIGTDPGADRKRRTPAPGDLRLLLTRVQGHTKAVLFRAISPGVPKGRDVTYQSPVGKTNFDEVEDISSRLQLAESAGDFELSLPLEILGLRPVVGAEILGDLGLLRGDGSQTTQRIYWNNLATTLVSDIPSEARLEPGNWGIWKIR